MDKLKIIFCSYPDYSSNAKSLYTYMKKNYKNTMDMIWAIRTKEKKEELDQKNIPAIIIGSEEYYSYLKNVDIFFTTHCDLSGDKTQKSLYIELWHGLGMKKTGFALDNMNKDTENWFNHLRKNIDYFILPSDFWTYIFGTRFNIKPNRILTLGYPKLDHIINSNGKQNLEKLLKIDTSKYQKIIYYVPTFKKGCSRKSEAKVNQTNLINLNSYNEKILIDYLKENNFLLCIKYHPSEEMNFHLKENKNIKIINPNINIDELLNAADLLITDYSSIRYRIYHA